MPRRRKNPNPYVSLPPCLQTHAPPPIQNYSMPNSYIGPPRSQPYSIFPQHLHAYAQIPLLFQISPPIVLTPTPISYFLGPPIFYSGLIPNQTPVFSASAAAAPVVAPLLSNPSEEQELDSAGAPVADCGTGGDSPSAAVARAGSPADIASSAQEDPANVVTDTASAAVARASAPAATSSSSHEDPANVDIASSAQEDPANVDSGTAGDSPSIAYVAGVSAQRRPMPKALPINKYSLRLQVARLSKQIGKIVNDEPTSVTLDLLQKAEEGFEVKPAGAAGRGVFASKPIERGNFVLEYKGDLISAKEAIAREKQDRGPHSYRFFFNYKNRILCIDASKETPFYGRLLNHSLKGNLIPKCVAVNGSPHIIFYALRSIAIGEELCYNYGDFRPSVVKAHSRMTAPPTEDLPQCVICISPLALEKVVLPCGHTFCKSCIEEWLQTNVTCPLCRKQASK